VKQLAQPPIFSAPGTAAGDLQPTGTRWPVLKTIANRAHRIEGNHMGNVSYNLIEDALTSAGLHFQGLLMEYFWSPNKPFVAFLTAMVIIGFFYAIYQWFTLQSWRPMITYILTVLFVSIVASFNGQSAQNEYVGIANEAEVQLSRERGLIGDKTNNVNALFSIINGTMSAVVQYCTEAVSDVVNGVENSKPDMSALITIRVIELLNTQVNGTEDVSKSINKFLSQNEPDGCGYVSSVVATGDKSLDSNAMAGVLNYIVFGSKAEYSATEGEAGGGWIKYLGANEESLNTFKAAYDKYAANPNKKITTEVLTECKDLPEKLHNEYGEAFDNARNIKIERMGFFPKWKEKIALYLTSNHAARNAFIRSNIEPLIEPNIKLEGESGLQGGVATIITTLGRWIGNFKEPIQARVFIHSFAYFQGYFQAFLFALFPILLVVLLFPGGFKFMINYFGMILWAKSWTFFAVLIASINNWMTLLLVGSADPSGLGLLDLTKYLPMFTGIMMWSVPLIAYAVIFGSWKDLTKLNFHSRVWAYGSAGMIAIASAVAKAIPPGAFSDAARSAVEAARDATKRH
jgi:hypothetical protein